MSTPRLVCVALAVCLALAATGCHSIQKENGIFRAKGTGIKLFTFNLPRTDFATVQDTVIQEVGAEAEITNIWKTGPSRPWYNLLYPILGIETIEIYGTY